VGLVNDLSRQRAAILAVVAMILAAARESMMGGSVAGWVATIGMLLILVGLRWMMLGLDEMAERDPGDVQ